MNKSESINELITALSKAQGEMTLAVKGSKNPFFKSTYSSLSDCWDSCRHPLTSNNLAIVQTIVLSDKNEIIVETTLAHSSGQWMSSQLSIPVSKNDAQSYGSALTYARRYGLCAIVGICPDDDDDGNAAVKSVEKKTVVRRTNITQEAATLINKCSDAEQLELVYKDLLPTITSTAEKDDLVAKCKAKKETFILANELVEDGISI